LDTLWKIIVECVTHTPTWVYVLFAYLVWRGVKALRTRTVSFKRLLIVPIVFIWLSIHSLLMVQSNVYNYGAYIVAILLGILAGYEMIHHMDITVDKQHRLLKLPGSSMTLWLVMFIFFTKYLFGAMLGFNPAFAKVLGFTVPMLLISGVCTGMFIGRTICYVHKMCSQKSVNLEAVS